MTTTRVAYTLTIPGRLLTAKDAKIPHCDKVRIIATPLQCKGRLADPGGHAVVVKAAIDGLVDSGSD